MNYAWAIAIDLPENGYKTILPFFNDEFGSYPKMTYRNRIEAIKAAIYLSRLSNDGAFYKAVPFPKTHAI